MTLECSKLFQTVPGGGNTRPPTNLSDSSEMSVSESVPTDPEVSDCSEPPTKKAKTVSPARYWIFTWNNYPENWLAHFSVHQAPHGKLAGYAGGEEVAPTTGTPHIQGWIDFGKDRKNRPSALKLPKQIRWKTMRGEPHHNHNYCSKEGKYVAWGTCLKAAPFTMDIELMKWMRDLLELLDQPPDTRSIWWVWEPIGKAGKTTFQKWYELNHKGEVLILSGKAHDMKNGIMKFREDNGSVPRVIMCNVPRSTEERFISWQGMEEIKDMLFYSGKYEGGMVNDRSPHFVIFANWRPQTSNMSGDRWNIVRIPNGRGEGKVQEHDWRTEEEKKADQDEYGNDPYL